MAKHAKLLDQIEGMMENITRLVDDAAYLRQDRRYASSFALAVIAMEGVGKIICQQWQGMKLDAGLDTKPFRMFHFRHQTAVVSLAIGVLLIPKFMERIDKDSAVTALILSKMLTDSSTERFFRHIQTRSLSKARELALYWDESNHEEGRAAETIMDSDIQEVFDHINTAAHNLTNVRAMVLAATMNKATPEMWERLQAAG